MATELSPWAHGDGGDHEEEHKEQQPQQQDLCDATSATSSSSDAKVVCESCSYGFVLATRFRGDCVLCVKCRDEGITRVAFCVGENRYIAWARATTIQDVTDCRQAQSERLCGNTPACTFLLQGDMVPTVQLGRHRLLQLRQVEHGNSWPVFQMFREWLTVPRGLRVTFPSYGGMAFLTEARVPRTHRGLNPFLEFRVKVALALTSQAQITHVPLRFFQYPEHSIAV